MLANRRVDTKPELLLRSALHRSGLRFRKDLRIDFSGGGSVRPDVVFTGARVAVFIDGCFWHRCPEHFQRPKANRAFWDAKISSSVDRDRRVDEALTADGWTVLRFWEHMPFEEIVIAIADRVRSSRGGDLRPRRARWGSVLERLPEEARRLASPA